MAFSKSPTFDTYSSERVSLFREIALRDGGNAGKDEDYLNTFIEIVKQSKAGDQRRFVVKRAGTTLQVASVVSENIRGMYFWADQNKLLYCVNNDMYVYNVNTASTTTLSNVFSTTSGVVDFCEFLYDSGTTKIIATDGSATSGIITIDSSNTVVTASDVDLPAHNPNLVFLDGYLFIVETSTGKIFNSDNNDPLSWTVDAYIVAEQEADLTIKIAKVNNYLLAFGRNSVEYYWDAANAAPDSPMQRNDSPIKYNGYIAGLAQYGNSLYYIGNDDHGQPDVFKLSDFKIENIGTPSISRYLNQAGAVLSAWTGNIIGIQGHTFYVVSAGSSKTWAIDLDNGLVTRFAYQSGNTFDLLYTIPVKSNTNVRTYFCLNNSTSAIYKFDESLYQDNGVNFSCIITTENNDFGTVNRKFMGRLSLICDRPGDASDISVQYTDDDYQTYTAARTINMNLNLPAIRQLGEFRNRAFKFTYTDNYPMRLQDIEVDINKGNS